MNKVSLLLGNCNQSPFCCALLGYGDQVSWLQDYLSDEASDRRDDGMCLYVCPLCACHMCPFVCVYVMCLFICVCVRISHMLCGVVCAIT